MLYVSSQTLPKGGTKSRKTSEVNRECYYYMLNVSYILRHQMIPDAIKYPISNIQHQGILTSF